MNAEELLQLVKRIAEYMTESPITGKWTAKRNSSHDVTLTRGEFCLFFNKDRKPGRICVTGDYNQGQAHKYSDDPQVEITINPTRPPDALAADVERRFLLDYYNLYGILKERLQGHIKRRERARQIADGIIKVTGGKMSNSNLNGNNSEEVKLSSHFDWQADGIGINSCRVSASNVSLEIRSMEPNMALELFEFLTNQSKIELEFKESQKDD